jgi:hypothetical protein
MTPCDACQDGEHSECDDPYETTMERDTGARHVVLCCCFDPNDDPPAWILP